MSNPDPQQRVELVERLLALTRSSTLSWDRNDQNFNFVAHSRDLRYVVYNRDDDDDHPFGLQVLTTHTGQSLVHLESDHPDDSMSPADLTFVARLRDLYFEAKRQGMGLDPVARIFADLDALG